MNNEAIIELGRRVRVYGYAMNTEEGLIVAIRGKLTGEKPRPGVMQFIRDDQATFDIITFDGRMHSGKREFNVGGIGIGKIDLLDRVHGPAMIERAYRLVAEKTAADALQKVTARQNFEASEAARVITDAPVFYWNGIKDAKGEKLQKAYYSCGELNNYEAGTLSIYASKYEDFSAKVSDCFAIKNETDTMTDYFCKDSIRVIPSHPLYPQVKAAFEAQEAYRARRAAKRA